MKLQALRITLNPSYSANAGKYSGEMEWQDERGSTQLVLDPEVSEAILAFIGPVITKFAHQNALKLEQALIASVETAQRGGTKEIAI
jgi:hypothetical protein